MKVNVIRTTPAHEDLRRILTYFLDQNEPGVGSRFADAFEETLEFVAEFPDLGIPLESDESRLKNVRVKPVRGFENYLIFYRVSSDNVLVLRVFHGHQDIENLL